MSIPPRPGGVSNRILSALPVEENWRPTFFAKLIVLNGGDSLYEADQPISNAHFVLDGIGSVVATMEEGTSIEVMIVGWEGMVGLHALEAPNAVLRPPLLCRYQVAPYRDQRRCRAKRIRSAAERSSVADAAVSAIRFGSGISMRRVQPPARSGRAAGALALDGE